MADANFDGINKLVILPSIGSFDVKANLYSAWKEWVAQGANAKFLPAFETTGGDAIGTGQEIAPYFFLRNDLGWRLQMPNASGDITLSGNLFARDPNTTLFVAAAGFDAFLRLEVSSQAIAVTQEQQIQKLDQIQSYTNLIPAIL